MVLLVALCAAVYAAALITFKAGIVIIPGITELRPANLLPMAFSLLFGPAAAWGSALGNLIGDFFGTLGPASFFGFIGNFFLGYVPYKIWGHLGPFSSGEEPRMRRPCQWLELVTISFISGAVCAVVISWGVEILGLVPFKVLCTVITINNTAAHIIAGFLLLLLWDRVKGIGLYWRDIMDPRDIAAPKAPYIGVILLTMGGIGGWIVVALLIPSASIVPVGAAFVIVIGVASFLL
ncbi:MAG: QueT transporter family protein [Deltaproteobacteria bacterium]|nr:QueT transporter family protein [Deltaproteobacteria bacterium]